VTPAGHCSTIDGLLADRVTHAGHCLTIDGRPAVGSAAAVLPLRPVSVPFARPSAVGAAAEGSGPAVVDFAVFGFSQPVAVVALAQTGAAAELGLAVPGFYQRVAVVAQTGAAAVEPAATVPVVVVVFAQPSVGSAAAEPVAVAVCVPASVGAVRRFSARSTRRLCPAVTRRQERKRLQISQMN